MMYQDKMAFAIKVDGRVLREFKDTTYLPFGSEYSFLIKNLNNRRAVVHIEVDGTKVTRDGLVVNANTSVDLERFITSNLSQGNKFKFVERTAAIEKHRGVEMEDGLVRIEWEYEREYPSLSNMPFPTSLRGSTGDSIYNTLLGSSTWCSTTLSNGGGVQGGSSYNPLSMQEDYFFASAASASASDETVMARGQINDVGITVEGSISEQRFINIDIQTDGKKHVMVMQLKGETEQGVVEKPVTVKTKFKCDNCGTNNKTASKFCTECGTGLQIPI